jgi:hypothetical protein
VNREANISFVTAQREVEELGTWVRTMSFFVHRLLLEYFTTLNEPMASECISSKDKAEK